MVFFSQLEKRLWYAAGLCLFSIYLLAFVGRPLANALRDRNLLRLSVLSLFLITAIVILAGLLRSRPGWRPLLAVTGVSLVYVVLLTGIPMMPEERLHFLEYGLVGALVYLALRERERHRLEIRDPPRAWVDRGPPALVAVILTALSGWLDEGIQGVLPERYYDTRDVLFNLFAGLLAVASVKLVEAARRREHRERIGAGDRRS